MFKVAFAIHSFIKLPDRKIGFALKSTTVLTATNALEFIEPSSLRRVGVILDACLWSRAEGTNIECWNRWSGWRRMRDCGRIIGFGIELVVVKDCCGRDGNEVLFLKAAGLQEEETVLLA